MSGKLFQFLSAGILHFNCLNFGLSMALPSSTIEIFLAEDTPLHRTITETEVSLLGSLAAIGALISTPFMGLLLDRLGRKRSAIVGSTLLLLSWCLLLVSRRVELALISAFIAGIGSFIFLVVVIFIGEFADDSIRGTLTSAAIAFYGLGMLISYLLGGFLKYNQLVYVCTSLCALGVALQTILRESPMHLLTKGFEKEAAQSMAFYRNAKADSIIVQQELDKIKRALAPQTAEISPEEEKLTLESNEKQLTEKLSSWQFFKRSASTKRAFFICMVTMPLSIFQGMAIVQVYAKPLFSEAIPEEVLSPTWCSVLLAAVAGVAGLVTAYLTDLTGRRTLLIWGSISSGILCVALGTQIHLHWGPHWLTALFMYLFCCTFTMGGGTIPMLIIGELFLPEIKSVMSMIIMEWTWLISFVALFIFNPLVLAIGLGPVFYLFAAVCFLTAVFTFAFLPETKGLSVKAIQLLLVPKNEHKNIYETKGNNILS